MKDEKETALIAKRCNRLKGANGNYKFNVKEVSSTWGAFANELTFIENVDFVFDDSSVKTIEFPLMPNFKNSSKFPNLLVYSFAV